MGSIVEIIKLIMQILPMIKELINIFKGQPPEEVKKAQEEAIKAARKHCEGIGCAPDLKR